MPKIVSRKFPFQERAHRGDYYEVVELAVEGGADVPESVLSVDLMQCTGKRHEDAAKHLPKVVSPYDVHLVSKLDLDSPDSVHVRTGADCSDR